MSDEQTVDTLAGLSVVENELERVIGELDEMQDRRGIPALDRVSLDPLQWALNKLSDDLHDASAEIRNARQKHLDEHLQWASFFNGLRAELETVKAERDSLKQENDWLRQSKDAAIIVMDEARERVAELTKKLGELPPETAPEPYQWQVGDEIEDDGGVRRPVTERNAKGWVFIKGNGALPQFEWELRRWKLYRKASDMPDLPPLTPQQVAEFAAVAEPGWEVGDRVLSANTGLVWTVDSKSAGSVTLRHIAMPIHATIDELKGAGFTLTDKNHPCKCAVGCSQPRNPISGSVGTDGEGQP
jgi:hypothetical protein